MNLLEVSLLPDLNHACPLTRISALLDQFSRHPIQLVPWPAFPYKPGVLFSIAHNNTGIAVKYFVQEAHIRAVNTQVNGPVWEDSCVEFFISFEPGWYYNIEFNCMGTGLMGYGTGKDGRELLPAQAVGKINALALLNSWRHNSVEWELTLLIPLEVFIHTSIGSLSGKTGKANFYKCGDLLPQPHFLAWSAVQSPQPDFHRPESFGQVFFR